MPVVGPAPSVLSPRLRSPAGTRPPTAVTPQPRTRQLPSLLGTACRTCAPRSPLPILKATAVPDAPRTVSPAPTDCDVPHTPCAGPLACLPPPHAPPPRGGRWRSCHATR